MKNSTKFIKNLIILLIIITIILLILNQLYVTIILKKKILPLNQQQFNEYKINNDLKIIAVGDSLTNFAFNPAYINNSFNLATPGENLEQTYYKVKWLINNEPNIEVYVLQYNYHSFVYYRIKPYFVTTYWKTFMTYEELSKVKETSKYKLYFEIMFPIIGKGEEVVKTIVKKFYLNRSTRIFINGWINDSTIFPEAVDNTTQIAENRAYSQFRHYPIVREEYLTKKFFDILQLLKDNNKKVVLIKYPLTDEYLTAIERDIDIHEEYKEIDKRIESFDYEIINYMEIFRYNQTLFVDSDHLNIKGSKILSKQLAEKL